MMGEKEIKSTLDALENAPEGKEIQVSMKGATIIPKEILEAAKGKDVNVVLDMGGYSWSINGKDILASDLNKINLEVSFDKDIIPSNTIQSLAGENPYKQLSLTHNGNFGFKANLTFNLGKEYTGKFGNLYYYDSDEKLVFMNAGKIDENGDVIVGFSHASEYVIIVNEKNMNEDAQKIITKTGNNQTNTIMLLSFIVLCGFAVAYPKKQRKN